MGRRIDLSAVKSGPLILQGGDVGAYQFQAQPDYAQTYNFPINGDPLCGLPASVSMQEALTTCDETDAYRL
jgi:hypothetical protein